MNRRTFLKSFGLLAVEKTLSPFPLNLFLQAVTQGCLSRAFAEQGQMSSKKWLDLVLHGAPYLWHYDLFLKTSPSDKLTENAMVANCFEKGVPVYKTITRTINRQTVELPWLWQVEVPRSSGGNRPMTDLLSHYLSIRGVYTGLDQHPGNQNLHFRSSGSQQSISAYPSDVSSKPIPALSLNAAYFKENFKSLNSKSPVNMFGNGNLAQRLIEPFKPSNNPPTRIRSLEERVKAPIDRAREALASQSTKDQIAYRFMEESRKLLNQNFGDLTVEWNRLVTKYQGLIGRAFKSNLRGITDTGILYDPKNQTHQLTTWEMVPPEKTDLGVFFQTDVTANGMARGFALAEFVLMNDLSDSISLGGFQAVKMVNGVAKTLTFDQHGVGSVPGIILNSLWAVAHAACLLELIDRLKSVPNLWENTLINTSGEMIRSPRKDGSGSDHAKTAHFTFYSGCIDGPLVIGDIAKEGELALASPVTYGGTWGEAVPRKEIRMEQVHNTIAVMLGLGETGSPHKMIPARPPLVKLVSGKVQSISGTGKLV